MSNPNDNDPTPENYFGNPITAYSRADAINDGVLVDLTKLMTDYGMKIFRYPTACTREVWESCIEWTKDDAANSSTPQDLAGRLWDVLNMALNAIRTLGGNGALVEFDVSCVNRPLRLGSSVEELRASTVHHLKAIIGPGDNHEPVITIMFKDQS